MIWDKQDANTASLTAKQLSLIKGMSDADPTVRATTFTEAGGIRPWPGFGDLLLHGLGDPDASVRASAIADAPNVLCSPSRRSIDVMVKLLEMQASDPVRQVRDQALFCVQLIDHDSLRVWLQPRTDVLARSGAEADRQRAALALDGMVDMSRPVGQSYRSSILDLEMLLKDPSAVVRGAAGVAITRYVRYDAPSAEPAKLVVQQLAEPSMLDPKARTAMLADVPWLAAAGVGDFMHHADPEIRAAAMLGIEQPPTPTNVLFKINQQHRTPIEVAVTALHSPSQRVRHLAIYSLLFEDPADPKRRIDGAAAVLVAAGDPDKAVAMDALDALVDWFCANPRGPSSYIFREAPAGSCEGAPTAAVSKQFQSAVNGSTTDRVAALKTFESSNPFYVLATVWRAFPALVDDSDAPVSSAALDAARKMVRRALEDRLPAAVAKARS